MAGTSVYGWNGYGVGDYSEAPYHYAEAAITTDFAVGGHQTRVSKITSAIPLSFSVSGSVVRVLASAEAVVAAAFDIGADLAMASRVDIETSFALSASPTFYHFIYAEADISVEIAASALVSAALSAGAGLDVIFTFGANNYTGPKWPAVTDEQDWDAIAADNANWQPVEKVAWEN